MSNPYEAPETRSESVPKPKRIGIWLLFVFLLMLGGCAVVSLLFLSAPMSTTPAPAQPTPLRTPAE